MKNQFAKAASAFYDAFETRLRDNGEAFVSIADDAPAWMRDAIYQAHNNGGRMPCDAIYTLCRDAAAFIVDACDADGNSSDYAHEFADGAVSVYNGARAQWLADDVRNADYIDDAVSEGLASLDAGIFQVIGAGMYLQAEEVFGAIYSAIEDNADEYPARYSAGWNMPGYMPDVEAEEFADFDDAKAYILETLLSFEESDGEAADACRGEGDAEGFESLERNAEEYRAAAEELNLYTSAPVSLRAGAFVFWIVERVE